jgi:OmpA-OmpF porin, OOP family
MRLPAFILFLILSWSLSAQHAPDKRAVALVTKAQELLKKRDFPGAESALRQAIGRDSTYAEAYLRLINIYNVQLRQLDKGFQIQRHYVRHVPADKLNPRVVENMAQYALNNGYYHDAAFYLGKIPVQPTPSASLKLLKLSVDFALEQIQDPTSLILTELPMSVNRYAHQYLPVLTVDQRTLIYTARATETSDENIVFSTFDGQSWSPAQSISDKINTRFNEGACTISADGRTMIFTSCDGRQGFGDCDLFMTRKTGSEWSKPINLGPNINSAYWDSQPALSADGRTLYFVSTRIGGVGGKDIWVSYRVEDDWLPAVNLGPSINTSLDESTPYIYADNVTLYFSSNGYPGMGGFDLYRSVRKEGKWSIPENLGYPLNTHLDEVSLFVTADGRMGYFTKEELGGQGRITSSRLVSYKLPDSWKSEVKYVVGKVMDATTQKPLDATISLVDLSNRDKAFVSESDPKTGLFYIVLPGNREFGAFVEKQGYLFDDLVFNANALPNDTLRLFLQPVAVGRKVILRNVYFEVDSDLLNDRSTEELIRAANFLKQNPGVCVEISGHTDSQGGKAHNVDLSQRRANRVKEFLITQGIPAVQIKAVGMGSAQPAATNDTPEGRQLNRRIEFKVTSMDK